MKRLTIAILVSLFSACSNKREEQLTGEWQNVSIQAGIIQSWFDKDSIEKKDGSIIKSSNPLIKNNSLLIINTDSTYSVNKDGITEEAGHWYKSQDSIITLSNGNVRRVYSIEIINNDSLIILEPSFEKVETLNAVGYFRMIKIKLKKVKD